MGVSTTAHGYPKIGKNREFKKAIEAYWNGEISRERMVELLEEVDRQRLEKAIKSGLDFVPSNDFSLYDFILDHSTMFDVIPERFRDIEDGIDRYFAIARGTQKAVASEMTKWFDTNYHYIVPEFTGHFKLVKNRPLISYRWAKESAGVDTKPIITGPFTYLYSGKVFEREEGNLILKQVRAIESQLFEPMLMKLAEIYNVLLKELEMEGVKAVQIDEPALVLELPERYTDLFIKAYKILTEGLSIDIFVHTYYESLEHFERIVYQLPVSGIGLDFTVNDENLSNLEKYGFPKDKYIIAGIVSGRDPWKTDYSDAVRLIEKISRFSDRIILSNAAPLFHLPVTVESEKGHLSDELLKLLSFADERLEELNTLKKIINEGMEIPSQNLREIREKYSNTEVQTEVKQLEEKEIKRAHPFKERYRKQMEILGLPRFPTTTIGSFPQTKEVRQMRARFRKGEIGPQEYEEFIKNQIKNAIEIQEEIGLDVFVHGEFERTDMVEFFGEKLEGFAFTKNGWVQSYGTRCVRPPIIYGDVSRPAPMTLKEIVYAQSLTDKPVKGMLTGPVTILNWSYYRKDIPKYQIAYQIALALKEEVLDLEKAGIKVIQIDEPAFREGLPLKKRKQEEYLQWAVKAFRATHDTVREETQIHTHMCYSDFNEIIQWIYEMDADVISIEASRSRGEIIEAFERFRYDHGIGVGVYDIHSPRIPQVEEMLEIAERTVKVIDKNLIWINPDCGLKTRKWEEVIPALKNMVRVARILREKYGEKYDW
ncbi:5-methyltetrahydropteroyltriglutamate--homocysteine S-methyltransferase [Persephonella sp.]